MKIGITTLRIQNLGGQYQLLHLARELEKLGHEVYIYTLYGEITDFNINSLKNLNIKSAGLKNPVETPHSQISGFIIYIFHLFKVNFQLIKLLKKEDLDIFNVHDWPLQWAAVYLKLTKGIPVVWMCNDMWQIPSYEETREKRIVFFIGKRIILAPMDILFTLFVDKIVVLSEMASKIVKNYYHKDSIVIRTGIDTKQLKNAPSFEEARKRLKIKNEFIFLCLHAFFPHRRFQDVVMAFKQLVFEYPNNIIKLYIVGSDKFNPLYADQIRQLIKSSNLENKVEIITNYLSNKDVVNYLVAGNVFIAPHEKYMWGLAVTEAMAVGKPCIVSSEVGAKEMMGNNERGLVFPVKNVEQLKKKMKLLLNDQKFSKKLGKKAKEHILKTLSWEKYTKDMERAFREIINN